MGLIPYEQHTEGRVRKLSGLHEIHPHTITYIDGSTGEIIWILGDKRNAFEDVSRDKSRATDIAYQHFARFHNLNEFSVLLAYKIAMHPTKDVDEVNKMLVSAFDTGAGHEWTGNRPSRGVLIEITYPTTGAPSGFVEGVYTASLVQEYFHPAQFVSPSQGSMQILLSTDGSDPRVLLGFGYVGVWTEFLLMEKSFATIASPQCHIGKKGMFNHIELSKWLGGAIPAGRLL